MDKQIEQLKEHVSWVLSWNKLTENEYMINTDTGKTYRFIFCKAANVFEIVKDDAIAPTWFVIQDYLPAKEVERLAFSRGKNWIPLFFDVRSKLAHNRLVSRLLDGIDWTEGLRT